MSRWFYGPELQGYIEPSDGWEYIGLTEGFIPKELKEEEWEDPQQTKKKGKTRRRRRREMSET